MPKSKAPKNPQENEGKIVKSKKSIIVMLLLVLVVATVSVVGAYFVFTNYFQPAKASEVKNNVNAVDLDLGEVVVNLAGDGGSHYLRVKIVLEYDKNKKLGEELSKNKPKVMDALISYLRGKSAADISKPDSMKTLKDGLKDVVNNQLDSGRITDLFFTDFMVQ